MEFLGPDDEVNVWQAVEQFLTAALGHAAHEAEYQSGTTPTRIGDQRLHFVQRLLFSHVPHTAGVQENDIGGGLRMRECIPAGDQLGGYRLTVALIHLASVSFDVNTRHEALKNNRKR
jgi:hypothetical protein